MSTTERKESWGQVLTVDPKVAYVGHMGKTAQTIATDPVTASFVRFAKREPREGDFYAEAPEKMLDEAGEDLVEVRTCWTFENGRWEGFISVQRGGTWAR